jgi:uncharacterized peroxidase-related enzyme
MVSRIVSLTLDTASSASRDVMQHVKEAVGKVPNLYATMAHSPAALRGLLTFEHDLDKSGRLSKRDVELIALRMAQLNGCGYCLSAHYVFSEKVGLKSSEIDAARAGYSSEPRERAVLDFVTRLVRTGGSGAGGELEELRSNGVTDEEVLEIMARVALLGFANAVGALARPRIDWPEAPRLPQHG